MDIENLNKSQIILLTLLVSFMTSIATGIVTVSLMEQAPPAITQTVNKVIEHTVEKAVPSQVAAAAMEPVEKTVYVKQSETVAQAVEVASPGVVRLVTVEEVPSFVALGVVLDKAGLVVTDSSALGDSAHASIMFPGETSVRMFVKSRDDVTGLAYLVPATSTPGVTWNPAALSTKHPTLGKTVVALAGRTVTRIGVGVITALSSLLAENKDGIQVLETNISPDDILPGSPLIDTDGSIEGVSTGAARASSERGFIGSSAFVMELDTKETEVEEST